MSAVRRRLAIVGGGPRAVYALECLARRQDRQAATLPECIDIYEPHELLGTGSAYEVDQPDWVLLNLPIDVVDIGALPSAAGPTRSALAESMAIWSGGSGRPDEDYYPPRSHAGRYINELAQVCIDRLSTTRVNHLRREVVAVERAGDGFVVRTGSGVAFYDSVLLVTGHSRRWSGQLDRSPGGTSPVFGALPLKRLSAAAALRRPRRACLRGASLTAIDAVLALTEGVGGRFVTGPDDSRMFTYVPGPIDVILTMVSRTGRLMTVKTESNVLQRYRISEVAAPGLAAFVAAGRADVGDLVRAMAVDLLRSVGRSWSNKGGEQPESRVDRALTELVNVDPIDFDPGDGYDRLRRSLQVAQGLLEPDAGWAIGQAWRCAYPTLIRLQRIINEGESTATLRWPAYGQFAPELERLAFGLPPANARKLLALMEAGRLSVVSLSNEPFATVAGRHDFVVDAVTAPPGVRRIEDPLWKQLIRDGLVEVAPYGRGLLIDDAAGCIGADGSVTPGLFAVGRMTEDVVLGNDTLSRILHPDLEEWASRLCNDQELASCPVRS